MTTAWAILLGILVYCLTWVVVTRMNNDQEDPPECDAVGFRQAPTSDDEEE